MELTKQIQNIVSNYEATTLPPKIAQATALKTAMLAAMQDALSQPGQLAQALLAADFKVTPENLAMVEVLVNNGFSAKKENIVKMNQAQRLTKGDLRAAIFMLRNEMSLNEANAAILRAFAAGKENLAEHVAALARLVADLPASPDKTAILSHFLPIESPETPVLPPESRVMPLSSDTTMPKISQAVQNTPIPMLTPKIIDLPPNFTLPQLETQLLEASDGQISVLQAFELGTEAVTQLLETIFAEQPEILSHAKELATKHFQPRVVTGKTSDAAPTPPERQAIIDNFALKPNDIQNFPQLATRLYKAVETARLELPRLSAQAAVISEVLDNIANNMEFLTNLRESILIQIPINFYNQHEQAELFIFQNKQKQTGAGKGGQASALISLNLPNLGLVEGYVRREGHLVSLQFRLGDEAKQGLFRENITDLEENLVKIGFNLNSVLYRKITEKFKLTESEPAMDAAPAASAKIHNLDVLT